MYKINTNYQKLPGSYLFSNIAKKVNAFTEAHPEADIIRLGIGRAGLEYREPCREGEAELGYLITPEHWRKGYATEVCQAILSYAKDELGMERIISHVDERNLASRQFLGKMGFQGKQMPDEWIYSYNL